MDFFTHIVLSVTIARLVLKDETKQRAFILGAVAIDFDVFLAWLPGIFRQLFLLNHRGIFHTIFFSSIAVAVVIFVTQHLNSIIRFNRMQDFLQDIKTDLTKSTLAFGILGSYLHMLMDVITPPGLIFLFPLSNQRFSTDTIFFLDPIITVMSISFVLWFVFQRLYKLQRPSIVTIDKVTRLISVSFVVILAVYGSLQLYTINTHHPVSTQPGPLPFYRWALDEQNETYSVHLINQFTQQIEQTFSYTILTWNQSNWNTSTIQLVLKQTRQSYEYQNHIFRLDPAAHVVYNVSFNTVEDAWEVRTLDIYRDAQSKVFGLSSTPFFNPEIIIFVQL